MKLPRFWLLAVLGLFLCCQASAVTVVVDDVFADGSSRNQDIPNNSLNIFDGRTGATGTSGGTNFTRTDAPGSMTLNLNTSTSSQGAWIFFTGNQATTAGSPPVSMGAWSNTAPLSLEVGDTLTCIETFSVAGLKTNQDIRVGLWDSGGTRNGANGTGGQNDASFANDFGYGLDFFLNGSSAPFMIGKRDLVLASSLSALNNPFLNLGAFPALAGTSGSTMPALQPLSNNTPYTLTFSVYRQDATTNIVTATVTGADIVGAYTWQTVDPSAPAVTFDTFTAGRFNGAGLADSIKYTELKVLYTPALPAITAQPTFAWGSTAQTVGAGGQVILSVTASGSALTYQWQKDLVPIAGATSATVTLTNLQLTDSGNYIVVVTNGGGNVTSNSVNLSVINGTVGPPPSIDVQPASQAANNGTDVSLTVAATGDGLTYQWYQNTMAITGAKTSLLSLPHLQIRDAGSYTVAISNDGGTVTSNPAVVTVLSPGLIVSNLYPGFSAANLSPDSPLRLTFSTAPSFGTSGLIKIFDAATDLVVDTIDVSSPSQTGSLSYLSGVPYQVKTIGDGANYSYYPILIDGTTATIYPRNNTLSYNKTYYVQIDAGFFKDNLGVFGGIKDKTTWRFTTQTTGPALGSTTLTVAADGTGNFCTVQGALDFVPTGNTTPTAIYVRRGVYREMVYLTGKHTLSLIGEDRKQTVIAYADNATFNNTPGFYRRGVFYANGVNDLVVTNLTIRNLTPQNGSQAEAMILSGSLTARAILANIDLYSYQDTLQINGQAYVANSYVEGDIDFLWGSGPCFFSNDVIKILRTGGYYTQIRNDATRHGYVFLNCRLSAGSNITDTYLARIDPNVGQFPYSEVVWLNTVMGSFVTPAGWLLNNATTAPNVHFWEYNSRDPSGKALNLSGRAPFSKQLALATDASTISDYSTPSYVLGGWTPQMAPIITTQPQPQIVTVGQPAFFSITVASIPDATYQWQRDGTPIAGAIGAIYTLSSVSPADVGDYSVIVTNGSTSVPSAPAALSLSTTQPIITIQPASQSAIAGSNVTFTFVVTGAAPFTYQWSKDGAPLSGATSASLELSSVQLADASNYLVTVTNAVGTAISSPANLTVANPAGGPGLPLPIIPAGNFNITTYGAVGDGLTDNTGAIQAAISAARAAGGGTIEIPAAAQPYESGPITLYSNMNLQVDTGATLQALPFGIYPNSLTAPTHFITVTTNSTNVELSGGGTIDGNGAAWWAAFNNATITARPRLVQFNHVTTLLVTGLTFSNSPMFHLAFNTTNYVTIFAVTVTAPSDAPNTDGMDPAGSHYLFQNCNISVGDDNIVLKPGGVLCTDIRIAQSTFGAGHGVSIGGQTNTGLDGLTMTDCTFNGTSVGLRLKADATQGGPVQNVSFNNITMTNVQYPILFYSYYNQIGSPGAISGSSQTTLAKVNSWNTTPPNPLNTTTLPSWKNIAVNNLTATGASGYSTIWGLPLADDLIANVTLNNVNISGGAGLEIFDATNVLITGKSNVGPFVTGNALGITGQPQSQTLAAGANATLTVTAFGGGGVAPLPSTYQWALNGTPLVDGPRADGAMLSGTNTANLTINNVQIGEAGKYAVTVSNRLDGYSVATSTLVNNTLPVSAISSAASLTIIDAFSAFAQSYGLDPATNGAPNADPDGDGLSNLLEFVLGSNPTIADQSVLPTSTYRTTNGGPVLIYAYNHVKAAAGVVSTVVEYSSDLTTWKSAFDGKDGVAISVTSLDAANEHIVVSIPALSTPLFARLHLSH